MLHLADLQKHTSQVEVSFASGEVSSVSGNTVIATIPLTAIGDLCIIEQRGGTQIPAQVVAFHEHQVKLAPFGSLEGVAPGSRVHNTHAPPRVVISDQLIGSAVDALGDPLEVPTIEQSSRSATWSIERAPICPLSRSAVDTQLHTGIPQIDGLFGLAYGQRIGLFASAGLGKTTLLQNIARNAQVDLCVIALVGERSREVHDFLIRSKEESWADRSIVVVATSDEPSIKRKLAATTATAIAEYFRDQGLHVLLLVDSLTRTARAIREVGFAAGEIPVRQGYTSSVFTELPRLLERSGNTPTGSITGIYTVLTNPNQQEDPLADELKSLLDGHWVLSDWAVQTGFRPAIDPTVSLSRIAGAIYDSSHLQATERITRLLRKLKQERDFILMGGVPDQELQAVMSALPELRLLFHQDLLGPRSDYSHDSKKLQSKLLEISSQLAQSISSPAKEE